MTPRKDRHPHGRRVRGAGGSWAYVPAPLPPPIRWSSGLAAVLSDADRAVGHLAGEARRLPNLQLLVHSFVRREAVLSSRIEGTRTTLGELLAAEAGSTVARDPGDLREVGNHVVALEHGVKRLGALPLSLRLVRELQRKLMDGVRGKTATPGEFRRTQNWIGPAGARLNEATYVPPPPDLLGECLDPWEKFLHDQAQPPLVHAALIHSQFEAIHPFLDGNGRVGRLVITLLLIARGVLPSPLLCLSAYFEASRQEYYARLLGVTAKGEWEEWLVYFLRGVAMQAEDASNRIRSMDELRARWLQRLASSSSRIPDQALDLLMENPFWMVKPMAERLGVAFTTAQRAVDRLEKAGILTLATKAKRNRVYCARELLALLDKPSAASSTRGFPSLD